MFKIIRKIRFMFIRRKILNMLPYTGCDVDGDIIVYKNKRYFVHELKKIVQEVK
jgi:hypothetical protein